MKYKVTLLENAGAQIRAQKERADSLGGILVFNEKKHGGFRQRTSVTNDLREKRIVCAALQTVDNEGKRLFRVQLLLHGENHAFVFTVAPYELGNAHGLMRESAHGRLDLSLNDHG